MFFLYYQWAAVMNLAISSGIFPRMLSIHRLGSLLNVKTFASVTEDCRKSHTQQCVKKFDEIPGPKSLPVIGTIYLYLLGNLIILN